MSSGCIVAKPEVIQLGEKSASGQVASCQLNSIFRKALSDTCLPYPRIGQVTENPTFQAIASVYVLRKRGIRSLYRPMSALGTRNELVLLQKCLKLTAPRGCRRFGPARCPRLP
jgi:hypothetical protein